MPVKADAVRLAWPQDALFAGARRVIGRLESVGWHAWLVGGAVRDALRGQSVHDIDIATDAPPDQVLTLFRGAAGTGLAHGTVSVREGGLWYEVTTLRTDGVYLDGRRPLHVEFTTDLTVDLARRDFTINAMAATISGDILDPFNGRADLAAGIVRAVGEPEARFAEDGLRVARAYRFAASFGFSIERDTACAASHCASVLAKVSVERRRDEFVKWLTALRAPLCAIPSEDVLQAWLSVSSPAVELCEAVCALPGDWRVRLAAVARRNSGGGSKVDPQTADIAAARWIGGLRLSRRDSLAVRGLLELAAQWRCNPPYLSLSAQAAYQRSGPDGLWLSACLAGDQADPPEIIPIDTARAQAKALWEKTRVHGLAELAVSGTDIVQHTELRGSEIGQALAYLYERTARGEVENDPDKLLQALSYWRTPHEGGAGHLDDTPK